MKPQDLSLHVSKRRTRKTVIVDYMSLAVTWSELLKLNAPHERQSKTGRPLFEMETMIRIHFVQQWPGSSELAIAEVLRASH